MKKLLITLLFFTFYCNSSFAKPNTLWDKISSVSKQPLSNEIYSYIFKSQLKCSVIGKATKHNAFIKTTRCTNAANTECLILTDTKNLVEEYYCLDPLTAMQFNINITN